MNSPSLHFQIDPAERLDGAVSLSQSADLKFASRFSHWKNTRTCLRAQSPRKRQCTGFTAHANDALPSLAVHWQLPQNPLIESVRSTVLFLSPEGRVKLDRFRQICGRGS